MSLIDAWKNGRWTLQRVTTNFEASDEVMEQAGKAARAASLTSVGGCGG